MSIRRIFRYELFLNWPYPKANQKHPSNSSHVWVWLDTPDFTQPTVMVYVTTLLYFHAKKSKITIDFFQSLMIKESYNGIT